jgi:acetyl esterase
MRFRMLRSAGMALPLFLTVWLAMPCFAQTSETSNRFIEKNDRDGDGKLSLDEMPEQAQRLFAKVDADGDGFITADEDAAFRASRDKMKEGKKKMENELPEPDYPNVKYGPHERNVFDFWKAETDTPAPLVIFYHGGGFRGGDKSKLHPSLLELLHKEGFAVAAANYRLSGSAPYPAQMLDCARALQFMRSNAEEYGFDPTRAGGTGGSAGAGISLWLGFHEDLVDPQSDDPVARQSSRVQAAAVTAGQSSYDPRFIMDLFDTDQVDDALIPFFGMKSAADVADPKFHPLFEESSPINHLTADDCPVRLYYPQPNDPLPENSPGKLHIHHPKFGIVLKEKMDALGIECVLKIEDEDQEMKRLPLAVEVTEFFKKHLKK